MLIWMLIGAHTCSWRCPESDFRHFSLPFFSTSLVSSELSKEQLVVLSGLWSRIFGSRHLVIPQRVKEKSQRRAEAQKHLGWKTESRTWLKLRVSDNAMNLQGGTSDCQIQPEDSSFLNMFPHVSTCFHMFPHVSTCFHMFPPFSNGKCF